MGWENSQKGLFSRGCVAAGIEDERRRLILGQCGGRAWFKGENSSKSPRLTQADYEHCMAVVEISSGGLIKLKKKNGQFIYSFGEWDRRAADGRRRRRLYLIGRMVETLKGNNRPDGDPVLDHAGNQLAGIVRRATSSRAGQLDQLTDPEASDVIDALTEFGERHGIQWSRDPRRAAKAIDYEYQQPQEAHVEF